MVLHHLMSTSVPEEAREQLHELVQARAGQILHLQLLDLPDFLERMQSLAESDELICDVDAFEMTTGVHPNSVPAISWMAAEAPPEDFQVAELDAERFPVRDNDWWLNPDATLEDAVAPIAA